MKINVSSRNNYNDTYGIVDILDEKIDQSVTQGSDVTFNSLIVTHDATVNGNFTVNGSFTKLLSDIATIKDNIILINSTETSSGVSLGLAGIEIDRGTSTDYQIVYQESSQSLKAGFIGSLQTVATRENTPLNNGVMVFDNTQNILRSVNNISIPITFSGGVDSTSSSTGSVIISNNGGLGVTGNAFFDNTIHLKGSSYSNYIRSDISDQLIFNSNGNTVFQQLSGSRVRIPTNVLLTLSSDNQKLYSDGTNVYLSSLVGDISLTPTNNGNVNLSTNTYINWGSGNRIRYNGTNITLESTGSFICSPIINCLNSTVSTNSTTGSIVTAGSIAISNIANSTNSSNGGTFTSAGGGAFNKDLYIGGNLNVTGTITSQISTPVISTANSLNITGTITNVNTSMTTNGTKNTLRTTFRLTPTVSGTDTSFEFVLPGVSTNFVNVYDIFIEVNGFYNDSNPSSIENKTGNAVVASTRGKVRFTSSSTLNHTIFVSVSYNAV